MVAHLIHKFYNIFPFFNHSFTSLNNLKVFLFILFYLLYIQPTILYIILFFTPSFNPCSSSVIFGIITPGESTK